METPRCLAIIAAYGKVELTHAVVGDLSAQIDQGDILVVDNMGDYVPVGSERVYRSPENVGWPRASNFGFRTAFSEGYTHAITINNDTRLSPTFVAGMLDHRLPADAGIVAPVYDFAVAGTPQVATYRGPASEYQPQPFFREYPIVDGTALLITREAWLAIGELDWRSFGFFGWGSEVDLCVRAKAAGFGIYISEMAYLNHFVSETAKSVAGGHLLYKLRSHWDLMRGFKRVHGKSYTSWITSKIKRSSAGEAPTRHPLEDSKSND